MSIATIDRKGLAPGAVDHGFSLLRRGTYCVHNLADN